METGTRKMAKRRSNTSNFQRSKNRIHKRQTTAAIFTGTKSVMKCENVEATVARSGVNSESNNTAEHLHLVHKDLLEFTNSLSKTIGSKRKNVLLALIATTEITVPTSQEPDQDLFVPICACLCELNGRDKGNFVVCEKNCCCRILLYPCQCGFEHPEGPSKVVNIKRPRLCNLRNNSDGNYSTADSASGKNDSEADCNVLNKETLQTGLPYGSMKDNVVKCAHRPQNRVIIKRKSCHGPPTVRMRIRNSAPHQTETAHSSWCRVVELTEREHLILSRAEKLHQSITKLSKSTWKNHAVQIFLVARPREVHIRGRNYHQGLQELLKEIKRATQWWEHDRSAVCSDDQQIKTTKNEGEGHLAESLAAVNKRPTNSPSPSPPSNAKKVGNRVGSPFLTSNLKVQLEHADPRDDEPINSSKECTAAGMENPSGQDTKGKDLDKTETVRRVTTYLTKTIRSMEVGQVCALEIPSLSHYKIMQHMIRLSSKNHTELVRKPELVEQVRELQRAIILRGTRRGFKIWLSSTDPIMGVVCKEDDFSRSYTIAMAFATKMGIRSYFPTLSTTPIKRMSVRTINKETPSPPSGGQEISSVETSTQLLAKKEIVSDKVSTGASNNRVPAQLPIPVFVPQGQAIPDPAPQRLHAVPVSVCHRQPTPVAAPQKQPVSSKTSKNEHESHSSGTGDTTAFNKDPSDLPRTCTKSEAEPDLNLTKSSLATSSPKAELQPVKRDTVKPLIGTKDNKEDDKAGPSDENCRLGPRGKDSFKTYTVLQSGPSVAGSPNHMEPGEIHTTEVKNSGSCKTILHWIRLCARNYADLVSKPGVAEEMKKLHEYFVLKRDMYDFQVRLSRTKPELLLICKEEDFWRSYAEFMDRAADMTLSHYFPRPRQPPQLQQQGQFPIIPFPQELPHATDGGGLQYQDNGHCLPGGQANSYPIGVNSMFPNPPVPTQQFPPWNNIAHDPTNYCITNGQKFGYPDAPFEFQATQNFGYAPDPYQVQETQYFESFYLNSNAAYRYHYHYQG